MDRHVVPSLSMDAVIDGSEATTAPGVAAAGPPYWWWWRADLAIFGDCDGAAAPMRRRRNVRNDMEPEPKTAEQGALQRSQLCSSE